MSASIALGVPGLRGESEFISAAPTHGIDVRRRCVDAADLLGACLGAPGLTAVVTSSLPRLSAEVIARLHSTGTKVIAIAVGPDDRASLEACGVEEIVDAGEDPRDVISRVAAVIAGHEAQRGVWNLDNSTIDTPTDIRTTAIAGRVIAVWGPAGAPGRTTTAVVLARCLAERARTVIIDADTSAPSVAFHLGLADDLGGIVVACRQAETATLTSRSLVSSLSKLSETFFAMTGVVHARRAAELRSGAFTRVLDKVRSDVDYSVIDIGASLDHDVASAALAVADVVVAVCRAEPLGVARFLVDLPDLAAHGAPIVAVFTGGHQAHQAQQLIHDAARGLGISIPTANFSLDPNALSSALRRGLPVHSRRRTSRKAGAVAQLVELVA